MNCSPTKIYALIGAAFGMLAAAIALANIFLHPVALGVAIGLVATVSFVMIPQIRAAIRAYIACRGPSQNCNIGPSIDTLGQAAAILSLVSWTLALALEVSAIAALASIFLSWLGVSLAAAAAALRLAGTAAAGACALILTGVFTNVSSYVSCRDSEVPSGGGGSPIN